MASKKKKTRSAMADAIADTLTELNKGEFPDDPTLNDEGQEISGPEKFVKGQKRKDEVIIDELWGGIVGKEGYFVKIKKEIRPNEWMMMKTVENDWRQWADIETAVFDLVRDHTKRWPHKWGSGLYRVEMTCRGGMRGQKYPIHDVYVNADEELQTMNPAAGGIAPEVSIKETVSDKLNELSGLVSMVSEIMPKPQDPSTIQTQIAQAFQTGMQMKSSESNSNAQMMQAMMTGMMGIITAVLTSRNGGGESDPMKHLNGMLDSLKTFGVLGGSNQAKEKTAIDFAKELRELGMDLFKREDPMEQVKKLKEIANVAVQMVGLSGDGEKPSIFERVIDMAVPMLPQLVDGVKQTMDKAVEAQKIAGQNIEKAAQAGRRMIVSPIVSNIPDEEKSTYQRMQEKEAMAKVGSPSEQNQSKVENPQVNPQVQMFFDSLYANIMQNNRMFYPVIYTSLLQDTNGVALIQNIGSGQQGANELIQLLMQYGGDRFRDAEFVNKYMVGYANGFVLWLQNMMGSNITQTAAPQQTQQNNGSINGVRVNGDEYQVECVQCGTVYGFATKQEFDNEPEKVCGAEIEGSGGQICPGILTPVVKV